MSLELYKNRLKAYKVEGKEGKIEDIKKRILDNFYNSPSYDEVFISGEARDVLIVSEGQKGNMIMCKPDETVNVGDYVVWDDEYYLITFKYTDDKVQTKASIQKCNHNLKWISTDNRLIIRPCIEDARTLYTTGIREDDKIDIPDGKVGIQLPYDEDTEPLNRGDCFIFNKTRYRVTFYDRTTHNGLLLLICDEITINKTTDDEVNEIANRWISIDGKMVDRLPWLDEQEPEIPPDDEPTEPEEPEEPENITYEITGDDGYGGDGTEIWSGDSATYTVKKYVDGVDVEGVFIFEIDRDDLATITKAENSYCIVEAKDMVIGGMLTLTITDTETNEVAGIVEIEIMSW